MERHSVRAALELCYTTYRTFGYRTFGYRTCDPHLRSVACSPPCTLPCTLSEGGTCKVLTLCVSMSVEARQRAAPQVRLKNSHECYQKPRPWLWFLTRATPFPLSTGRKPHSLTIAPMRQLSVQNPKVTQSITSRWLQMHESLGPATSELAHSAQAPDPARGPG